MVNCFIRVAAPEATSTSATRSTSPSFRNFAGARVALLDCGRRSRIVRGWPQTQFAASCATKCPTLGRAVRAGCWIDGRDDRVNRSQAESARST
jgi:hypothetical protein